MKCNMADRVRLQIKKISEPEEWEDVGVGVELPIKIKETIPTDTLNNNPSLSITEATVGTVTTTTIQKTIGGDVYQQTIREDSSDNSVTVSSWS